MTSSRPYLLRAIYEWLNDNNLTSYLLVDAEKPDVMVPTEHVQDGKIILNISPEAIDGISLENDYVSFSARFSGKSRDLYIPMAAVMALYAKENGKGMMFPEEEEEDDNSTTSAEQSNAPTSDGEASRSSVEKEEKTDSSKAKKKASFLKVVK